MQQRRPTAPARIPSVLGSDLVFEGSITGEGELQIEGSVRGEITVPRLLIGERSTVEGAVHGGHIEVRGKVLGNIDGKMVKLYESAHVEGDIVHEQLSIDVGAFFQGRCQQAKRVPAAPAATITPAPVKEPEVKTASAPSAELEKNAG